MQAVTCPRCGRELNVGREVHNVRLRCKACGEVFMGSTHPTDGPAAPASSRPARPASQPAAANPAQPAHPAVTEEQRARRAAIAAARQKSTVPMVLAIVGAIGAIVLVIVAFWLHNNPVVKVWDPQTKQYVQKRVSPAEAARLREEERKRKEQLATVGGTGDTRTSPDRPTPRSARNGGTSDVRDRPLQRYTGPDIGETDVIGDKHSRVTDLLLNFSDVGSSGTLTARFRNLHSDPVRSAKISITAINEAGARRAFKTARVQWVPPQHYVRFSIPFGGFSKDEGYAYLIKVDVQRDAKMLCFPVDRRGVGYEVLDADSDGAVELDGAATNRSSTRAMVDPKVIADFYKPNWYHEGSATGTLIGDGADRLEPGKNVYFRVRYRPQARYLRDRYEYQIRLIGTKAF